MLKLFSRLQFSLRKSLFLGVFPSSFFLCKFSTNQKPFEIIREEEKLYDKFEEIEKTGVIPDNEKIIPENEKIIDQFNKPPLEVSEINKAINALDDGLRTKNINSARLNQLIQDIVNRKEECRNLSVLLRVLALAFNIKEENQAIFLLQNMTDAIKAQFESFSEKQLLFIFWGCSKIKFNENEFLSSLAQKICSAAKTLPHEDCLSVLKIILDVKIYNNQLAADIYSNYAKKHLLPILETSDKPRVCTHLARSLYELGEEDSLIWGRLLKSMNDKIAQFSSFELTEYFWVLAKTNPINEEINWKQIAEILPKSLKTMTLNELNIVVWALQRLHFKLPSPLKSLFQERLFTLFQSKHHQLSEISLSQLCGSLLSFASLDLQSQALYSKTLSTINSKIIHLNTNDLIPLMSCLHLIKPNMRNEPIFKHLELFLSMRLGELDYPLLILIFRKYPFRTNNSFKENIMKLLLTKIAKFNQKELVSFVSSLSSVRKSVLPENLELIATTILPMIPKMELRLFSVFVKDFGSFRYSSPKSAEIMRFSENVITSLLEQDSNNLVKKQLEISCLLSGLSNYDYQNKVFWQKMESSLLKTFSILSPECRIVLTDVATKQFSDEFSAFLQQVTIKRMEGMQSHLLVEQLKAIERIPAKSIRDFFWMAVEQEIKARFSNNQIDIQELSQLLNTMRTHKAGSFKFWSEIAVNLGSTDNLQKINMKNVSSRQQLIHLLEAFRRNQKLSATFGNAILPSIINLTSQSQLFVYEITEIALSFSALKLVNDQLWFNLESHVLKIFKTMPFRKLLDVVISFGRVRRGSQNFWGMISGFLSQNKAKIDEFYLPLVLKAIENNPNFDLQAWADVYYQRMEGNLGDQEKFMKNVEDIGKNKFLMEKLRGADCLKMMKHWKEKVRSDVEDEKRRKNIDKILMDLIQE